MTVTDAGSRFTASGSTYVGGAGSGSLTVENQGNFVIGLDGLGSGGLGIGGTGTDATGTLWAGGMGTALVASGGSLFSQTDICVGENGDAGTLTVSGGAVTTDGRFLIGNSITLAPGATLISASGTTAVTSATVETGTGSVIVTGGTITAASLSLDADPGQAAAGSLDISTGGAVDLSGNGAVNASGGITLDGGTLMSRQPRPAMAAN